MSDHYLDRGEARIHYQVHGEDTGAAALFLTHGFSASTEMWQANVAQLGQDRRVITWDIRGHGRTAVAPLADLYSQAASVEDMVAVLDACGVEAAAVGGLSLGGYLSLEFHRAHPDRVKALLLFDTGPGYRSDNGREGWNRYARAQAERFETEGIEALGESPEMRLGPHDPAGLALAARHILTQEGPEVIESLGTISVPTLVLVGERDTGFLAAADYMAARIPGARKVILPGAGHGANIDQPAAFDRTVRDFLASAGI